MSSKVSDTRRSRPRRAKRRRGACRGVPPFRRLRLGLMTFRPFSGTSVFGTRVPRRGRHGRGRDRCGAGALLGVLLLAALAGAALAVHYETRDRERVLALDRAAGRVFADWLQAAHTATQAHADAFETALEVQTGVILTVARLRTLVPVPAGLPGRPGRDAAMVLGVIADGTARAEGSPPVPMAFAVLEPAAASRPTAIREGALEGGLAEVAPGAGSLMESHRPAIETAMGRALAAGALFVTADHGLRYRERALYRRAQPGRPWLNRMETTLAMAPPGATDPSDPARRHIADAGDVGGASAEIATNAAVGGDADIAGGAEAGDVSAATVEAGDLAAPRLAVAAELLVGAAVTGPLRASSVAASGRLEAGALRTAGVLDAASLSAAGSASIEGAASAREIAGEALRATGPLGAASGASRGVYGPDAAISGLLTVGSCAGCEGE